MTELVILTGAGLSAESGLGTFRDTDGLWTKVDLAEVATPEAFARDPAKVHDFYNARRANARRATPNAAHRALARLEAHLGDALVIVTQNVDGLHEAAGSQRVIHMHGILDGALCADCGARWRAPDIMDPADPCPACAAAATRPDIVWFGEYPHHMDRIETAIGEAAHFVAIGTSGSVYPAAGLVRLAAASGARTLELNLVPSEVAADFDVARQGPATGIVSAWVGDILAGGAIV